MFFDDAVFILMKHARIIISSMRINNVFHVHSSMKLSKTKCQTAIRYLSEKWTGSALTVFYVFRAMWRFMLS